MCVCVCVCVLEVTRKTLDEAIECICLQFVEFHCTLSSVYICVDPIVACLLLLLLLCFCRYSFVVVVVVL